MVWCLRGQMNLGRNRIEIDNRELALKVAEIN